MAKAEAEYAIKMVADTLIFIDKAEKGKNSQVQGQVLKGNIGFDEIANEAEGDFLFG